MTVKCDPFNDKFIATCFTFMGNWTPSYANTGLATIKTKRSVKFVDWAPCGLKCSLLYNMPEELIDNDH